jgi:hypothetical protein
MKIKGLWTVALTAWLVPVMSSVLSGGLAAQTPGPRMPFAGLEKLAAAASDTVDVSLDTTLLALAAKFLDDKGDPEQAGVKAMLGGLKGVYVRSYEFGADGAFGAADVEGIRRQLAGPGWSRMAGVRSKRDRADVDVYLWLDGETIGGLGILATEPRRLTVVNIVGAIDLDQLRRLEGFGLPRLGLERMADNVEKARDRSVIKEKEKIEKTGKPKSADKPKPKPDDED